MLNQFHEALELSETGTVLPFSLTQQFFKENSICTPPHFHEYIEAIYCLDGVCDIWLNDRYLNFKAGDLVVINIKEMHSISSRTGGSYICLKFLPDVIHATGSSAFEIKYITPFLINNSKHRRIFNAEELEKNDIPEMIFAALAENDRKEYGYELAVRTYISRIFLWILRFWNSQNIDLSFDASISPDLLISIQTVMDHIAVHFAEDISVSDAAAMCNVSYSYFSRIFKQVTKHSFSEYLNYVRISKAEQLLASTSLNITEIAMQTGFSTSSYFIQQFKLQKKISPKQFRKKLLERPQDI